MGEMLENLQYKLKSSSSSLALWMLKLVTGLGLGLTFSLIFSEVFHYGQLAFTFVIVTLTAAFLRVSKSWQFMGIAMFDLICILIGLLLRMYILVAPGG